jgi:hypothetical protein
MTEAQAAATLSGGAALLERAISYTLGQLDGVTTAALKNPTPCAKWNLAALLVHMTDSLTALQEAMDLREVAPVQATTPVQAPPPVQALPPPAPAPPPPGDRGSAGRGAALPGHSRPGNRPEINDPAAYLVAALRGRACHLLGSLAIVRDHLVFVGSYPVPVSIVTSAGAVDVAVHGWDVGCACGTPVPIPEELAQEMLRITPLLVTGADRPELFAQPVVVPEPASASDRLIGYLGRSPGLG